MQQATFNKISVRSAPTLRARQTGLGALGWLIVLAIASFALTCFFKVVDTLAKIAVTHELNTVRAERGRDAPEWCVKDSRGAFVPIRGLTPAARRGNYWSAPAGVLVARSAIMACVAARTASSQRDSPNSSASFPFLKAKMIPRELLMIAPSPLASNAAAASAEVPPWLP